MAWTNWGFDGTITEIQWAKLAGFLGSPYSAKDSSSCVVTAVSGARQVSVSAGTIYGDGVASVNDAPEVVSMTTPVNGQWYVIALRRTWATNTAALVAIAGATTTTSTPSTPPTSFPILNTDQGVLTDQPIAWAWCNSANTTVVVSDLRKLPLSDQVTALQTQDGVIAGQITALDGRTTTLEARNIAGLVQTTPTSVTYVSGSGSVSSGTVYLTNCTKLEVNGCFTSEFNTYTIIMNLASTNTAANHMRFTPRSGGADSGSAAYGAGYVVGQTGSGGAYVSANGTAYMNIGYTASNAQFGSIVDFIMAYAAVPKKIHFRSMGADGSLAQSAHGSAYHTASGNIDGFSIATSGGATFSGSVSIYGYNA